MLGREDTPGAVLACRALARLGSREALPELMQALTDPERELRDAAEQALRSLSKGDAELSALLAARVGG